jgi:Predicted membrane protein involved in D-alanine export
MQFTSFTFALFFLIVFLIYWLLPKENRWLVCLAASVLFYGMFGVGVLALLCACIVVCYFLGLLLESKKSKLLLAFSVLVSLSPLLFFKYYNFAIKAWLTILMPQIEFPSSILAPMGISFYTFKAVSYLIDVYRKDIKACRHFGHFALYISFFPEVSSGPIQRAGSLLPQIENPVSEFSYKQAIGGAQLFLWGIFKKMVIADNLSYYVYIGFSDPNKVIGLSVIIAAVLFSIQLYCDFSAYSDMAIGCMNMLGLQTPDNFKSPYFATSIKDFWARWHISLSSFLKDYVYIPLGGNRKGTLRKYINILITFIVSGLWHGAGFTFLVWGALHGICQIIGDITKPVRDALWRIVHIPKESHFAHAVQTFCTFIFVTAGWVVFQARDLAFAKLIFTRMTDIFPLSIQSIKNALVMLNFVPASLFYLVFCILLMFVVDYLSKAIGYTEWLQKHKPLVQMLFSYALVFFILFYGMAGTSTFIYFQF